jgi:Sporulation lipoprotein YhcN/YlaJ (Spore_YhcN_YlaJ)
LKKTLLTIGIGLCSLSVLAACQNDEAKSDLYQESGNTINVNDSRADLYRDVRKGDVSEDFGYVRHQRSPIAGEQMSNNHYTAIDREKLADAISTNVIALPNVQDAATLVTDEEVLIIYETDSTNLHLTADQVKKSAMAFVPRWYHVYVSDNPHLRDLANSYAQLDSDSRNAGNGINKLIKEMLKSPQGKDIKTEENANGETKGVRNPDSISEKNQ